MSNNMWCVECDGEIFGTFESWQACDAWISSDMLIHSNMKDQDYVIKHWIDVDGWTE